MSHFTPSNNIVFASPEYRLAPEYPAPAGAYDFYARLVYLVSYAKELDIDSSKIVLYGISGGAVSAASAALLSRKMGARSVRRWCWIFPCSTTGTRFTPVPISFGMARRGLGGWTRRPGTLFWVMVIGTILMV
ncbi:hypothetical protein BU25DRAFT_482523 [Macroventuria anomochaeta]|uniref:Uncharacterized protein n=1 Tax=Macroventuria anomochaeta TaxID=301207 RepID=A0ACB6RI14_9PLEO|nr:uncharacterized protein BU25DRAFT_482523 [Macroventuria anomochaeta]KAF2621590.1 hypothetical protein BU25DRAFT_482523 [Macroventuria anomochaeta]